MPFRHRRRRRLVRYGDTFTSDEDADFELPEPAPEPPEDEQAEPWGTAEDDPRFAGRNRAYREFLAQWERDHGHPE
jgi:hypothetical protein